MVDVNARFRYEGNFGPLQAQIKALTRDIGLLNASFVAMDRNALATKKALADSFSASISQTGQFKTSMVDLTSSTEQFGQAIQKNRLTLRQYFSEARKAYAHDSNTRRLAQQQVRMLQSQVIDMGEGAGGRRKGMVVTPLRLDTSDFTTKMQLASQQYAIFNQLVKDGATQLINWGKNTQWAGRQLTVGLTIPLTLFGVAVSKTFRDVDKELTRFAKVYGSDLVSANGQATEKMKQQVQELAVAYSSAYGIAAKETVGLAADIAATGAEGQKLLDSVAQTTRLAVLGEVERQEAMQTTLSLQSAFKMNTKELADSINFLNAVENQTSTSLQDFTAAIPKAGPVVRALGGDIKDLALMLTAMREGGIPAAEAANAIKSGLASMINPTKAASERLAKLGVDIQGIVDRNRGQLMPTLFEFQGVLETLDSFGRAKVIEELFGKYQFARISALFDNLNRQGSQTAQVMELMGASTVDLAKIANQEISTLTESVSMRFTRAMEGFKAALLPIGEVLTSSVIPFIEGAATAVGKMIEIFNNLPAPIKSGTKLLLGLTAVAGPLIMLTGVFANFIGYAIKGTMNLNNFARRLMGLPVEKLEIMDEQTIAAAKSTDLLTASFKREADSLKVLNQQLINYQANLRKTALVTPAVFVPGSPARPIKRSKGSTSPERVPGGYGGGDRIPALLEPGESVVTKEATSKYWPIISAMNKGKLPGLNLGTVFLGMTKRYQDTKKAKEIRETLTRSNKEATSGRFASMPVSDVGSKVSSIGGRSSSIPGVNGVYEKDGRKYVVKTHDTADSALAEIRGSQLTREVFGLKTPIQELIKIKHPTTGDVVFAVRSPYDAKFATSTGKLDKENFFSQSVASIVRRDKDLQSDNLYGDIVTDVGSAFVANKASQPRVIGGPVPSVQEQAEINFLMRKGGARRWFAEESAVLAKTMTEKEYVEGFRTAIDRAASKVRSAIDRLPYLDKTERDMYMRLVKDLDDAKKIDWAAIYQFHKTIVPEIKKPPTPAALAKKQAEEAEKARQRGEMSPWQYGMPFTFSKGGDSGSIPGYGGGDRIPALLEPGEFVVRKEVASKNRGFLRDLNSGKVRRYQGGGDVADLDGRVEPFAARAHVLSPEEFYRLVQSDPDLRRMAQAMGLDLTGASGEKLVARGFGAYTSGIYPQFINNAFANERGIPDWMKNGIPFTPDETRQMIRVLESMPNRNPNQDATLQYLKDNFANKTRSQISTDIARRIAGATILQRGIKPGDPLFDSELERETRRLSLVISGSRDPRYALARETLMLGSASGLRVISTEAQKKGAGRLPRGIKVGDISPAFSDVIPYGQTSSGGRTTNGSSSTSRPSTRPGQTLGPRGRIAAGFHPTTRFGPRPIVRAMPGEVMLPPTAYADNGAIVDKDGSVSPLQQRRGMMGSSLMNIGFAGSMLAGMTAMNGEVTAATSALTAFTTALMVAGTAIEMGQMFGGRGRGAAGSGLLGMGRAGAAMGAKGGAMRAAGAASGGIGGFFKSGAGMGMMGAGRALAFAGGPWGIAIAAALAVAVAGVVQFNRIMENMRQSAKASFAEATQSAEYFGIELGRSAERAQEFGDIVESLGLTAAATADQIDEDFVQRVGTDYEALINRLKGGKDTNLIANDLKLAYSSMIAQGFGEEEAIAIVEEVARQAEQRPIFLNIKGELEMLGDDPQKIANSIAENAAKGLQFAQQYVNKNIEKERGSFLTSFATDAAFGFGPQAAFDLFQGEQGQFLDFAGAFDTTKDFFGRMTDPTKRFSEDMQAALSTVTNAGEMFGASMNTLFEQFKQFPQETGPAMETVLGYVEALDEGQREAFSSSVADNFKENVADPALLLFYEQLGTSNEDLAMQMKLAQAASLGLSDGLSGLMSQGKLTAGAVDELIQKVIMLDSLNVQMDIEIDKGIDALKKQSKEATAAYDDKIKAEEKYIKKLDKEAETAQENHDAYMDSLEDESRALDDRAEKIQENAEKQQELIDKKIKSLQLSQEEATFEQQQRQRAFGVLGALMSGDTGAYETARLEYVQAQEDRQRELAIQGLEDRKEKIADEAEAKLDAIDKEKKAIEDRARAAQDAHEAYLKQNEENQEAAEKRIAKTERERNKVEKAIQQQINLLEQYKAQGYLTEEQVKELNIKLQKMGQKLPAGVRTAVEKISKEMFGPNGDYTRIVNGLVEEMAKALNVSPDQVRTMLGDTLTGQYPATPSSVGNQGTWWSRTSNAYTGRTGESPIPGRASGGRIEGPGTPTSDSILARLSRGEYVVKADSVRKLGTGTLDYINSTGRIPGFAQGSPGGVGAGQTAGGMWGTGPNAMTVLSIRALQDLYGKAVDDIKNTNTTTTTPATNVPTGEGSQWLANFLSSMGLSGEQLRVAYAIAMRESSGQPGLTSTMDGNGYGLFQVQFGVGHANTLNTVLGSSVTDNESDRQKFAQLMFDAQNNFKVMMYMSKNMEDLGAWGLHSWRNPTLNTRDYSGWTSSQHQAWIMEPFLRYYASFPGVDTSYAGTTTTTTTTGGSTAGQAAVNFATSQQGKPYSMTATPPSSWDCSKLTAWAWAVATGADPSRGYYDGGAKVRLTPYSHTQANEIQKRVIGNGGPISGLVPGDILYFRGTNGQSGGHTSMYVGNNQVFEASSPSVGLRYADLNNSWNQQYFAWGGSPPGYAEGGLVDPNAPSGDMPRGKFKNLIPGFRYGGSADRQEYAASQRTTYFGGTPTAAYARPSAYYYSTPAWTPYNKGLPPQYKNPVPTGRMAGTTKPYSTSGAYTADTATMYSQNYSHKLPAYATTGAHLSYLAAKANKNFGDTTGGRKWKQIASMLASPFNTPAKQRLTSASRGMPTTEYWRTLSREQKDWLIRYATTGKGTGWTGAKPFRILPWIGRPQDRNIPTSRFVDRVDYPTALNAYPNTVTIGQDGVAPTAPGFSDFNDGRVGISTNKSPYGLIPGTNIPVPRPPGAPATSAYPMGWDTTTRVPMDRPAKPSGSNYIWDPQRHMWISAENVGAGTSWGWPWDGSGTKDNIQSPIRFKPGMTPDTTRTSPQERYPIGMSGIYLGTRTWLGRTLDKFSSGQPLSLGERSSLNNLYEMLSPAEKSKLVAEMYRRSLSSEGSISLRSLNEISNLERGSSLRTLTNETGGEFDLIRRRNGGLIPGFKYGGMSADRAETAANNNVYAGGWTPKTKYYGSTTTSSNSPSYTTTSNLTGPYHLEQVVTRSNKRGREWWETGKRKSTINSIMRGTGEINSAQRSALAYALSKYGVSLQEGNQLSWKRLTRAQKDEIFNATQVSPQRYTPGSSFSSPSITSSITGPQARGEGTMPYDASWWTNSESEAKAKVRGLAGGANRWMIEHFLDTNGHHSYRIVPRAADNRPWWQKMLQPAYDDGAGHLKGLYNYKKGGTSPDNILARVSTGEYIMSAPAVSAIGVRNMDMINSGQLPGFNTGGLVKDPRFKLPRNKKIGKISDASTMVREGDRVEYNINIDVAETNASADEIANKVMRQLKVNENSRRLRANG